MTSSSSSTRRTVGGPPRKVPPATPPLRRPPIPTAAPTYSANSSTNTSKRASSSLLPVSASSSSRTTRQRRNHLTSASGSSSELPIQKHSEKEIIEISDSSEDDNAKTVAVDDEDDDDNDDDDWDEVELPVAIEPTTFRPPSEKRIRSILEPINTEMQEEDDDDDDEDDKGRERRSISNGGTGATTSTTGVKELDFGIGSLNQKSRIALKPGGRGSDDEEVVMEEVSMQPTDKKNPAEKKRRDVHKENGAAVNEAEEDGGGGGGGGFLPDPEAGGADTDDSFDLEAIYGYDFHSTPVTDAEGQTDGSASAGKTLGNRTTFKQANETIEVTLGSADGLTAEERHRRDLLALRRKPLTARDRALRLEAHKLHILTLLSNATVRNRWLTDDLLKSRLLSLTPHELHANFHIPPSRFPDPVQRSRLFLSALQELAIWWANEFFVVSDTTLGVRTKSWEEVMDIIDSLPRLVQAGGAGSSTTAGKGKQRKKEEDVTDTQEAFIAALGEGGERIRTVKSLMKKALQGTGGRDTSAQLFVALCRALGLGARLVVSLQPVQWKSDRPPPAKMSGSGKARISRTGERVRALLNGVGQEENDLATVQDIQRHEPTAPVRTKARRRGEKVAKTASEEEEEDEFEEVNIPSANESNKHSTGKKGPRWIDTRGKFPLSNGNRLGTDTPTASDAESDSSPIAGPSGTSPFQPKQKDMSQLYRLRKDRPKKLGSAPLLAKPKKKKLVDLHDQPPVFWTEVYDRPDQKWIPVDPVRGTIKRKKDFEPSNDHGPIRMLYVVAFEEDGYARDVTVRYAKTFGAKTSKLRVPVRKDGEDWWERVMKMVERPYRLQRDDLEDAELATSQISEGMPMAMNGFKDHPLYVLERHLKREEVIIPKREVGRFKGEPVYRRTSVVSCKTPENWMRIGRKVKFKEEPLKWVKQRVVTLDKRRAAELAELEGKEAMQQGLYAEWQTELYTPPPIRDGVIPTNAFGNIDLYVPTMLPRGAAHLPYKGIVKVAKQLKIPYAEACTGFEFKKQRAIPVITGIVVAKDQEEMVLDAYWESEAAAQERALTKKQEKAILRWKKLIRGVQIRQRLQRQYGEETQATSLPSQTTASVSVARKKLQAMGTARIQEASTSTGLNALPPQQPEGSLEGGGFLPEEEEPAMGGGFIVEREARDDDNHDEHDRSLGAEFVPEEDNSPLAVHSEREVDVVKPLPTRPTRLKLNVTPRTSVQFPSSSEVADPPATNGQRKVPTAARPTRGTGSRAKKAKTEQASVPAQGTRRSLRSHAKTEEAIRKSLNEEAITDDEG